MTETPPGPPPSPQLEQLMTHSLSARPLTEQSMERVRAAVLREWQAATDAAPRAAGRGARRVWVAAVLAVASLAGGIVWWAAPLQPRESIGLMTRVAEGAVSVHSGMFRQRRAASGEALQVGDRLEVAGPVLVSLARGGTLRIASGSRLSVTGPARLALERGLIYLDLPPNAHPGGVLRVDTRAGAVLHMGTEFEIMSNDYGVRVRVREGQIRFVGSSDTLIANAGTELLAERGKPVAERTIDTYGRDWLWTAALAPDFDIDGRSLIGFLQWVSRELGRPLNFADPHARQVADRTVLHGSVRHQAPIDAMTNVLATTSLSYEIRDEAIWVRSSTAAL